MPAYQNILVALDFRMNYESEVGVFLITGSVEYLGEAQLYHKGFKLYANMAMDKDVSDYYPEVNSIAGKVDVLVLHADCRHEKIQSIKVQTGQK